MLLKYDKPANVWTEALPLGNGRLGGMVFGGIKHERVQLNEDTLWSGPPLDWNNSGARDVLPKVRQAILDGKYEEADLLCKQMMGPYTQSYMPLGDLIIAFDHEGEARDYERELNIQNAVSTVRYSCDDVTVNRETWISHPDQVLVMRLEADRPRALNFSIGLESKLHFKTRVEGRDLVMEGRAPRHVDPNYYNRENPIIFEDEHGHGMSFIAQVHVTVEDGTVTGDGEVLRIKDATAATILLAAATSYAGFQQKPTKDPRPVVTAALEGAGQKSYHELKVRHVADFRSLFDRVTLTLGDQNSQLPTDQRVIQFGANDPGLVELLFQYGRYLLISSSRPGTQPANLQGIWNDAIRPPWSSNYTLNINTEMNYWPAEVCNLAECHTPLFDFIAELAVSGSKTAEVNYGCRGWVAHHNADLWRQTAPAGDFGNGMPVWTMWPMAGAWLAQHLWEHFSFGGDREYLETRAYPIMKSAAEFCLDWLVEGPDGWLVTMPSTSPEHLFITPNGEKSGVCMSATMDTAVIWDLFTNCIEASHILDVDQSFREQLVQARERLLPMPISKEGYLQEWSVDWQDNEIHHRHVSHLFPLHPGRQITVEKTPEYFDAVRRSLERRGQGGTGWSLAWKVSLWARLLDGEKAFELIANSLTPVWLPGERRADGGVYPNLFGAHPPFQIDGNFGVTAGIAELLLQSHEGFLRLLPALPSAWPSGKITGLRARGGFVVDLEWNDGHLTHATVQSTLGGVCTITVGNGVTRQNPAGCVFCDGNAVKTVIDADGKVSFETERGQLYQLQTDLSE